MTARKRKFSVPHQNIPTLTIGMKQLQDKVKKAKNDKKIFILTTKYDAIRYGLLMRDWLERVLDDEINSVQSGTERFKIALLLKNVPFDLVWQPRRRPVKPADGTFPLMNSIWRQPPFDFTRKDGLNTLANNFHWNYVKDFTKLQYQRSHILFDRNSKEEFYEDFRQTAFTSFILFLNDHEDIRWLFSKTGDLNMEIIEFSIQKVELLMKIDDHDDIDMTSLFDTCAKFPKNQRATLAGIKDVTSGKRKFRFEDSESIQKFLERVKICAKKILDRWPHYRYDGYKNLWIFKPLGASSGYGVSVLNDEDKIKSLFIASKTTTFVAQKYIERPMLIHKRKFDIRIYFLTFIRDKFVHIWVYKDCYIKFATHPFTCDSFAKSIHVTNYAVQKFFMNANQTVPGAKENMWTLTQFIEYVQTIDKPRLWESVIYPAIKQNLLAVILPSLEGTELVQNTFELNGADFMIGYDHEPILIEVNSAPALFFSKTVMEMITTKLLDDVLKVVVDHTSNKNAYVGDFELIYSQEIFNSNDTLDLTILGKKIERSIDRELFNKTIVKVREDEFIQYKHKTVTHDGNKYIYVKQS